MPRKAFRRSEYRGKIEVVDLMCSNTSSIIWCKWRSPVSGSQWDGMTTINRVQLRKKKNVSIQWKWCKHTLQICPSSACGPLRFQSHCEVIVQVEVQADMNDIAMKPVIQMVIAKDGGNDIHSFQLNRDNCDRWSDNFRPELPRGGGLRQGIIRLEGG